MDSWLIFDIGNVVIKLAKPFVPAMFTGATANERKTLEAHLFDDFEIGKTNFSLTEKYQTGLISTAEYVKTLSSAINNRFTAEQVIQDMNSLLIEEDHGTVEIIQNLIDNHNIACLSNTSEMHWINLHERFPVMKLFKRSFTSFELKLAKPEPACYNQVCSELGVDPSKCILVDDREKNIVGAKAVGIKTVHFTDSSLLPMQLKKLGVG